MQTSAICRFHTADTARRRMGGWGWGAAPDSRAAQEDGRQPQAGGAGERGLLRAPPAAGQQAHLPPRGFRRQGHGPLQEVVHRVHGDDGRLTRARTERAARP